MPLPNDPVGAGADMSQWQNWLMSMLQAQPNQPARPAGVSATGLPLQPGSLSPAALGQFANAGGGVGSGGYVPTPYGGGSAPGSASAVPGSPAARGINLGYYRPMTGNARQAQWVGPNDPGNAFRGPLASPPATQTIPPTATASVPPAAPITARPDLAQRMPQNQWPQPPVRPGGWPFNQ
jgi:hypothetical protein